MGLNRYQRLFGSGPPGLVISVILLWPAHWAATRWPAYALGLPQWARVTALVVGSVACVLILLASLRALPPARRGQALCTRGIFRWLRHPLYAAFLSALTPGLALYLDHLAYLLWALALHPLWHGLIRYEEGLMRRAFGQDYAHYASRTGRFLPRLWRSAK